MSEFHKIIINKIFFCCLFWCLSNLAIGQSYLSNPVIKNYPKNIYNGGTQTWDISEGYNGLVFFANNDGLLVFDGDKYTKFPLPKNTILRSIFFDDKTNRIYAGGQNEIGFFKINKNGSIEFESLANLLPANLKGFEDIWNIETFENNVYFQTNTHIFIFNGKTITCISPSSNNLENLYKVRNELFVTDGVGAIFKIYNINYTKIITKSNLDISSLLPFGKNDILITTYKNGIFILKNNEITKPFNNDNILKTNRIYKACLLGNIYILASNRAGVFFLDSLGNILNNIDIKDGLQNNNVLSLFKDRNNNLWLGLDNGIDLVRLNYPFGYIQPDGFLKGTGYAVNEFNNYYYFGTNNGLYVRLKNNNSSDAFQLVENTEGQVWSVQVVKNKLLVCHHEGLFEVNGFKANKILDIRGCWKLINLEKNVGNFVLGTYKGLFLLKLENNNFVLKTKLNRFKESSRFLEEDENGNIWVGHPYKGIYKITLNKDLQSVQQVKLYNKKDGLPNDFENYVFSTDIGLTFATTNGIYKYRTDLDKFELNKSFINLLDTLKNYKRIFNGKNGNIWFITNQEIGYLKPKYNGFEYNYSKYILPKLDQNLVGGFEFLNECSDGNIFIGVETGFENINMNQIKRFTIQLPSVMVTNISSLNQLDSIFYRYINSTENVLVINNKSIEFSFSSPNSYYYKDLLFSSYLEGWEKKWSPWKSSNFREFSRLSYGDYVFHIKAKCMDLEGLETIIKIHIPAPWYFNKYAKFIYAILTILILIMIGFYPQMLVRKKASKEIAEKDSFFKQQTETLRLEKDRQEKELIELKNQQLLLEVEHQGKELASSTMHIVQKSEKPLSIKDKLKHILQVSNDPKIKPEISELIKDIDKDTLIDKDWEKFELYFNNIHESFTQSLKAKFPLLSPNDIKMCAYLRMNLSTKEISSILNISTRGVEISRYRLRKKMELDAGTNLTDYLSRL